MEQLPHTQRLQPPPLQQPQLHITPQLLHTQPHITLHLMLQPLIIQKINIQAKNHIMT